MTTHRRSPLNDPLQMIPLNNTFERPPTPRPQKNPPHCFAPFMGILLLPPTSKGWGRYGFHRSLSVYSPAGYPPSPRFFSRSLVSGPFWGYSSPRFFPRSFLGAPQSQVLSEFTGPRPFLRGYPVLARGYPSPGQGDPSPRFFPRSLVPGPFWGGTSVLAEGYLSMETEQQSKHLLRSGRYASCIHAGGLSCHCICDVHTCHLQEEKVGQNWCNPHPNATRCYTSGWWGRLDGCFFWNLFENATMCLHPSPPPPPPPRKRVSGQRNNFQKNRHPPPSPPHPETFYTLWQLIYLEWYLIRYLCGARLLKYF